MKKILLTGAASLVVATAPVFSAFAEAPTLDNGEGSAQHNVTVGEIDEATYSVDIDWGDLTFDWKYDAESNEYNFQPKMRCAGRMFTDDESGTSDFNAYMDSFGLYTDNTCSTALDPRKGEFVPGSMYYWLEPSAAEISIKDSTVNGRVKLDAAFTAEAKYSWIDAKFGSWFMEGVKGPSDEYMHYSYHFNEVDPVSGSNETVRFNYDYGDYRLYLSNFILEKNDQYDAETMSSGFVSAEDKIGKITINIAPDLN